MNDEPIDLSQLALDRSPTSETPALKPRRRRWVARYLLPLAILLGFFGLLGAAVGRRLLPAKTVTVVPVVVKRAAAQQQGTALFQAAGWIEPRPTAISVAALAPGVIEELLVVEGQQVSKHEPIARLIAIDAELAAQRAESSLAIREGELNRAYAERDAAKLRLENPVHLQVQLADAESMLARSNTELAKLPFLIQSAEADLQYAVRSMQGKRAAKDAIAERIVQQSESVHASANATLQELRQREPNLQAEVSALQDKVNALRRQLDLLIEERRQLQEAEAKVQSSMALRDEAKLELQQARLMTQRSVIRAPMDGRILRLVAAPGTRVMGLEATAGQNSSTVVEMYDPKRLQVRADVRLEDVPLIVRGQPVEIETASSADILHGRVLQATSSANVQKNTLEVKIELNNPPSTVSPEMLVIATFLAPPMVDAQADSVQSERVFVPSQLVRSDDSESFVWVVDANQTAQRRIVELGRAGADGMSEVKTGLRFTDKLIASGVEGLRPGDSVNAIKDDPRLGME